MEVADEMTLVVELEVSETVLELWILDAELEELINEANPLPFVATQ